MAERITAIIPAEGVLPLCKHILLNSKYHRGQHKLRLESSFVSSPSSAVLLLMRIGSSLVFSSTEWAILESTSSYTWKFFGYLKSSHSPREQYSKFNKALDLSKTCEGKGDYILERCWGTKAMRLFFFRFLDFVRSITTSLQQNRPLAPRHLRSQLPPNGQPTSTVIDENMRRKLN